MNELPKKLQARTERKAAKRDEKKRQLAASALEALKELGYANTSLRDIAERSDLSLGMLHYYFEDKNELIIRCVATYKAEFVETVRMSIAGHATRADTINAFSVALAKSITDEGGTHKLWYDIRNQSMFDATFLPAVTEIEASLMEMVAAFLREVGKDGEVDTETSYAMLDGMFRLYTHKHLLSPIKPDDLAETFRTTLTTLIGDA